MKTHGSEKALVLSSRDRLMEELKELRSGIERIYNEGPREDGDVTIVKKCLAFTMGDIDRHNAEFKDFQKDTDNGS